MKTNFRKISLLVSGALLIGLFQNCGQNMLFQGGVSSQKPNLISIDTREGNLGNPNDPDLINPDSANPDTKNPDLENPALPIPELPAPELPDSNPTYPETPGQPPGAGNKDKEKENEAPAPPASALGAMNYVCILQGPGRSLRVGLSDAKLESQSSVPQSVCMSQKACLEMVSLKLAVKEAVLSGPCQNNPNVIHLNDDEIADLVGYP